MRLLPLLVLILTLFCIWLPGAHAATLQASNCSQQAVQNAVNSANPGDMVYIPAGSCTWASALSWTKPLTIQGAGQDSTVITANGNAAILMEASSGNFRLTGMGFAGTGGGSGGDTTLVDFAGVRTPAGTSYMIGWDFLRIDNCKFTATTCHNAIVIGGGDFTTHPKVLMDHITYISHVDGNACFSEFVKFWGANNIWQEADNYGSDKAYFIEDSTFTWDSGYAGLLTDMEGGVRAVIRHNTISGGTIAMHDTGSTQGYRGTRLVEVYENTISCPGGNNCNNYPGIKMRGGTGVYYNNTIGPGFFAAAQQQVWAVQNCIDYGSSRWLNSNGGMGCTDAIYDRICSTSTGHSVKSGYVGYPCIGYWDIPGGGPGDCQWSCTTDAECRPGGVGTEICLSHWDGQLGDSSDPGWPARDQNGQGKDDPVTHMNTISPIYWWNNKDQNGNLITLPAVNAYTQENRDYCNHDTSSACYSKAAWTYISYTYPHPLQGGVQPQTCGNNLREGTEACDGTDLAGQTCQSRGFTGGTLACNSQCTGFVTTACTSANPTCSSQGYYCCPSGYTCSQPASGTGCSGTCCTSQSACAAPSQYFQPEVNVQAESGTLSGMLTGSDGTSTYIYTSTDFRGSVSFTFDISQAGKYKMEARVNSNGDGGQNSFYVGLDSEAAQGNDYYSYHMFPLQTGFYWDNVSRWGNGQAGDPPVSEFDPMIWDLSAGLHTFTFYGRESNSWLDQIILKKACQKADSDCSGCISQPELIAFISRWYVNNQDVTIKELMEAIGLWKAVGC